MMITQGQQKMFGHLSNLSITSAAFDLEHRAATKTQVRILDFLPFYLSLPTSFLHFLYTAMVSEYRRTHRICLP